MMIRLHYLTAVLALMLLPAIQPVHAQESGRLQDRMSATDFYDAGLNKLSAKELVTLNQWLATHQGAQQATAGTTAAVADVAATETTSSTKWSLFGRGKRQAVDANLVGHFAGWTGSNLVTLDNGQQWQQVGDDKPMCNSSDNPKVKVKPSLFGNWLMDVQGCNMLVHVKRVK